MKKAGYLGSKDTGDPKNVLPFFAAMFYVYILYSEFSGLYYIGHTDDPDRRLFEHNNIEKTTFTSKHRPWILVFKYPISEERYEAMIVEKYIKKRKSRILINRLVDSKSDSEYLKKFFAKICKK